MNRLKPHGIDPGTDGQILKTLAGKARWATDAGAFNPDAGRSPWLVPYGVRLRGVNINAKVYSPDVGPWGKMFGEWDAVWESYIKPQIDLSASIGANAVRMMGAAPSVLEGYCTEDEYLTGYEQLVDYCATQGLWVYGVLSASQEFFGNTVADVMPIMLAQAAMLDRKPNVFAIDVCQEIGLTAGFISASSIHDAADQLTTPIRAVTTLPLTCSVTVVNNTTDEELQFAATTVTDYDDLFDFFDYHPYYNGMTVAEVETASDAAAAVGKVLVFGEFGATGTLSARYDAVAEAVQNIPNLVGGFAWAATDRTAGFTPDFGLFVDDDWSPRPALIEAFQKIPNHLHSQHSGHHISDDGTRLPDRARLNIVGATITDDLAGDQTVIEFETLDTAAEAERIRDVIGTALVAGSGMTVTVDDSGDTITLVSHGGELLMQDGVTAPPAPLETEAQDDWIYEG